MCVFFGTRFWRCSFLTNTRRLFQNLLGILITSKNIPHGWCQYQMKIKRWLWNSLLGNCFVLQWTAISLMKLDAVSYWLFCVLYWFDVYLTINRDISCQYGRGRRTYQNSGEMYSKYCNRRDWFSKVNTAIYVTKIRIVADILYDIEDADADLEAEEVCIDTIHVLNNSLPRIARFLSVSKCSSVWTSSSVLFIIHWSYVQKQEKLIS